MLDRTNLPMSEAEIKGSELLKHVGEGRDKWATFQVVAINKNIK